MVLAFAFMLLAAVPTLMAGPVPQIHRRQTLPPYSNTSSILNEASGAIASSLLSGSDVVDANTALVVEPIQETVFTSLLPAITFLDPEGKPLATQEVQTVLSTSFITPTPAPSIPQPSSTPQEPAATSHSEAKSANLPTQQVSSDTLSVSTRSASIVENGTSSETSRGVPQFTYSPAEEEPIASATPTPASDTLSNVTQPTPGLLPGFNHPGSVSRIVTASSIAVNTTTSIVSSSILSAIETALPSSVDSTILSTVAETSVLATGTPSKVFITKTEYTTVYPTPSPNNATSLEPSGTTRPILASPSTTIVDSVSTVPEETPAQTLSSIVASLPTTQLAPPPLVVVTEYTTVIPTPAPTESAEPSETSTAVELSSSAPIISSAIAEPSTSQASEPTPAPPAATSASSPASSSIQPNNPVETSSVPPSSAPTLPLPSDSPPAPTDFPVPAPEPTPSPTSEGPLIITPIPPSQIFTVTVTTTEKETIRETATVTVTA